MHRAATTPVGLHQHAAIAGEEFLHDHRLQRVRAAAPERPMDARVLEQPVEYRPQVLTGLSVEDQGFVPGHADRPAFNACLAAISMVRSRSL